MAFVLDELLEFKWRDVSFPVSRFGTQIQQDLIKHKWALRDGAHVEGTGRDALEITAQCHFRNGLSPATSETWGVLYPDGFRAFVRACLDRSSGPLQHPEFGLITCKFSGCNIEWDARMRDGVDISASWTETQDENVSFDEVLANPSPISGVLLNALDLDSQITEINRPEIDQPDESMTFTEAIQKLTSITDRASLLSKQVGGSIAHIEYRLTRLSDSISALRDPTHWPAIATIERMRASLHELRKVQATAVRDVSLYIVPRDQTLSMIAQTLANSIVDLIKLNPQAASGPVIPRGAKIRYLAKAA